MKTINVAMGFLVKRGKGTPAIPIGSVRKSFYASPNPKKVEKEDDWKAGLLR